MMDSNTHPGSRDPVRRVLQLALLVTLVLVVVAFFPTFRSIVSQWDSNGSFSHGFLIIPISLWLAWRQRGQLAGIQLRPSALGIPAVLACIVAWVVARAAGVLVLEQFAAVALVPAMVLAALGGPATRVLMFPLAFLFFMVPFGSGLVPYLMQSTADMASLLLKWTGIPVLKTHMYIAIPYGRFQVARACSGLNYFVTSLVLGVLYAYLNYAGWKKRLLCVAAFLVFPVLLNILRVYVIVVVSYLTEFRFGPGAEHVVFGRVFFIVVAILMFWIGRRWQDEPPPVTVVAAAAPTAPWVHWWPLLASLLLAVGAPTVVQSSIADARIRLADTESLLALPPAAAGWVGPKEGVGRWRPSYSGSIVERQAHYVAPDDKAVDVFVAAYGLGATQGSEMINHENVISTYEWNSLANDSRQELLLPGGKQLRFREVELRESTIPRLVWQWYVIGGRPLASPYAVKAFEALEFLSQGAHSERVVVVSTEMDENAAARLRAFVEAHGQCVALGFDPEACD
jgi:exosortase A